MTLPSLKFVYLKYLGKDNSSHEAVSTLYEINVSLLDLLKIDTHHFSGFWLRSNVK